MTIKTWDAAEARLAEIWPNYTPRPQQQKMAHWVTQTVHGNADADVLLAQAGCGVGKSLGYLIPAIASGGRIIVSVSTKALQDQLSGKDLPMLRDTLFPGLTFAVLKGRSNYVCLRAASKAGRTALIHAGSAGERQDLLAPVDDKAWSEISVDAEGCVGRKSCPFGQECYSEEARRKALSARVLVVNTSLLTQDMRFRAMTRGAASLLGDYDTLIVDEAHEMADIVASGLSTRLTLHRIMDTVSRLTYHLESKTVPTRAGQLMDTASAYFNGCRAWFDEQNKMGRGGVRTAELSAEDRDSLQEISELFGWLAGLVSRAECSCEPAVDLESGEEIPGCEYQKRCDSLMADLETFVVSDPTQARDVVWMEQTRTGNVALMSSPAEVGGFLNAAVWAPTHYDAPKAVLTSATLGVGGDFDYISRRLGIPKRTDIDVGTPFDFNRQARLYLAPASAPSPKEQSWRGWAQDETAQLVAASGGGALLLFTSSSAMRDAYERISPRIRRLNYQTRLQGDGETNRALADWFEKDTHGVLFATRSFMTGVDFAGDTCRLVVIDKMPFPVPDEPVFKARCKAADDKFGDRASFRKISIPEMSLVLIQAFGRLIRTVDDTGVVAILDPRMRAGWAAPIRRSLPPAPLVGSVDEVSAFYKTLRSAK